MSLSFVEKCSALLLASPKQKATWNCPYYANINIFALNSCQYIFLVSTCFLHKNKYFQLIRLVFLHCHRRRGNMQYKKPEQCPTPGQSFTLRTLRLSLAFVTGMSDLVLIVVWVAQWGLNLQWLQRLQLAHVLVSGVNLNCWQTLLPLHWAYDTLTSFAPSSSFYYLILCVWYWVHTQVLWSAWWLNKLLVNFSIKGRVTVTQNEMGVGKKAREKYIPLPIYVCYVTHRAWTWREAGLSGAGICSHAFFHVLILSMSLLLHCLPYSMNLM